MGFIYGINLNMQGNVPKAISQHPGLRNSLLQGTADWILKRHSLSQQVKKPDDTCDVGITNVRLVRMASVLSELYNTSHWEHKLHKLTPSPSVPPIKS